MKKYTVEGPLNDRIAARRGRLHSYESYDPASTAFVVIDMQNYFMRDGELGCCPSARDIVPNVNRLAGTLRDRGGLIVWIQMEASEESRTDWANFHESYLPEKRDTRFESLGAKGDGFTLWPELDVSPADEIVIKTRYSAFIEGSSNIEAVLRKHNIESVLVGGVATNVCCESTARDCMMRGFRTIMVADCNASFSEAEHEAALRGFINYFGDVHTTDEAVDILTRAAGSRAAAE